MPSGAHICKCLLSFNFCDLLHTNYFFPPKNSDSFKSWPEISSKLDRYAITLQSKLAQKDSALISSLHDQLSSFISFISLLAGIPPGTSPSLDTDSGVAKTHRHMTTSLRKLGLLISELAHENSQKDAEVSSTDIFQICLKETNSVVSHTKSFISAYCIFSGTDSISKQRPAVSTVKQFKAGMWTEIEVDSSASSTDLLKTSSKAISLESFDTSISIDSEVITVLENQRNMVVSILRQIFSLLDMKTTMVQQTGNLSSEQFYRDSQRLFSSLLSSLITIVTNMSNLIESLDLSIFQTKRRFKSLFLLYDFLELKQNLYNNIVALKISLESCKDDMIIDSLAQTLKELALSSSQPLEDNVTNEDVIKKRTLEIGVSIGSILQHATALAQERADLLGGPRLLSSATSIESGNSGQNRRLAHSPSNSSLATSHLSASGSGTNMGAQPSNDEPWYLQLDHQNELTVDSKGHFRGGTLRALVEHLTQHDITYRSFNSTFLLTYTSFSSAQEVFQELVSNRYDIKPPAGLTSEQISLWVDRKQRPIRVKVANIMNHWLDEFWFEDCLSKPIKILLASMLAFAERLGADDMPNHETITELIEDKLTNNTSRGKKITISGNPPAPIVPRSFKKAKITDIDPLEVARQLTIKEYKIFEKIKPSELLRKKERKALRTISEEIRFVDAFVSNSNELTNWVAQVILRSSEAKKRGQAIKFFVQVADQCRKLNNFSSMMAIISALYSATIHRMKQTWATVSTRTHETLENMNRLMNTAQNFADYRSMLKSIAPPAIPFFGVYAGDLAAFAQQPDDRRNNAVILFTKIQMHVAGVIRDITRFQDHRYNFAEVAAVQDMLAEGFEHSVPIDAQYETSLTLEPREKANDRMARLLSETGYL